MEQHGEAGYMYYTPRDISPSEAEVIPSFTIGSCEFEDACGTAQPWRQYPRVTAREIAMLSLMNSITEVSGWHLDVLDPGKLEGIRAEALARPLISQKAWEWCLKELQDKARLFETQHFTAVLDVGSSVCKSDDLVPTELGQLLRDDCRLLQKTSGTGALHGRVVDMVDPCLYPLMFDRTLVLQGTEETGLEDPLSCVGHGQVSSAEPGWRNSRHEDIRPLAELTDEEVEPWLGVTSIGSQRRWSSRFQWLPADVAFTSTDGDEARVRICSYINNLHPVRHRHFYGLLEKLIALSIEPWNSCLPSNGRTRAPLRIRTYGCETAALPDFMDEDTFSFNNAEKTPEGVQRTDLVNRARQYLMNLRSESGADTGEDQIIDQGLDELLDTIQTDYERLNTFKHPEPGTVVSYDDWRSGNTGRAIIEKRDEPDSWDVNPNVKPDDDEERYSVSLQTSFQEQDFPGQDWYFEAQMNEHIAATAVYYHDIDNITDSCLTFRQATDLEKKDYYFNPRVRHRENIGIDTWEALASVFDFSYDDSKDLDDQVPNVQELGSIPTHQGRYLAWPNTLQYRIEPFSLKDRTRPGHRRCIVLYLVDPYRRICSTAKVPPQQHSWWKEAALAKRNFDHVKAFQRVPAEIRDMIARATGEWPIGEEEAKRIREEVRWERRIAFKAAEALNVPMWVYYTKVPRAKARRVVMQLGNGC